MSFVDELRASSKPKDTWIESTASNIVWTVRITCDNQAHELNGRLSGYYHEPYEEDSSSGHIITNREPLQERTYRYAKGDSASASARKHMPPQCTEYYNRSLNDANLVKAKVEQGLRALGFTIYTVKVVSCEQFTVTRKLGWINDYIYTAKKTGKTGFCFYISVQW